jgi:hypothetical protein
LHQSSSDRHTLLFTAAELVGTAVGMIEQSNPVKIG